MICHICNKKLIEDYNSDNSYINYRCPSRALNNHLYAIYSPSLYSFVNFSAIIYDEFNLFFLYSDINANKTKIDKLNITANSLTNILHINAFFNPIILNNIPQFLPIFNKLMSLKAFS